MCDYVNRLTAVQEKVADRVYIVPRIYTNKPRTTGSVTRASPPAGSHKGSRHGGRSDRHAKDAHPGYRGERFYLRRRDRYPENWGYVEDLLSYVAIGARSVEDQHHRLTVSGFDVASRMKNPTSGDFSVMLNSVYAAQHPHHLPSPGYEV